jgi:hypothetical protein
MRPGHIFALLVAAAAGVAACTDSLDGGPSAPAPDGALRGELRVTVADFGDRRQVFHRLQLPSGEAQPLALATDPELPSGTPVRVWGRLEGGVLQVSRLLPDDLAAGPARQSALIEAPTKPVRRWAFVLLDLGAGLNLTKEQAQSRLFSDGPTSIRSIYRETSFGMQEIEGDVIGPISYRLQGCSFTALEDMATTVRAMIPGKYSQYLWYLGRAVSACDWGGLGDQGTALRPARDSWYNAWSACGVLIQEPGHNFGMDHSSSLRCMKDGKPVPLVLPGEGQCTDSEYGNTFDPMGDGECTHMGAVQKAYQDWLSGCNVVRVTGSGTFTIFPLEKACNGVQLLQIPMPATRMLGGVTLTHYYLELRAQVGLDAKLPAGVLVLAARDLRDSDRTGRRNWLLDMNPETTTRADAALPAGRTFSDPDAKGPKFMVLSASAEKAVVRIELDGTMVADDRPGAGTCDDGMSFTAPGTDTCTPPVRGSAGDGGPAVYWDAAPSDGGAERDGGADRAGAPGSGSDGPAPAGADGGGGKGGSGDAAATSDGPGTTPEPPRPNPRGEDARAGAGPAEDAAPIPAGARAAGLLGGCGCQMGAVPRAEAGPLLTAVLLLGAGVRARRRRRG